MAWCSDHGLPHSALLSWDEVDRAKLVAYLQEQAAKCPSCGTAAWEWVEDRDAYRPSSETCMGCYLKEVAGEDAPATPGLRVTLLPRRVAEAREAAMAALPGDEDDDDD